MTEDEAKFYVAVADATFWDACQIIWDRIRRPYVEAKIERTKKEIKKYRNLVKGRQKDINAIRDLRLKLMANKGGVLYTSPYQGLIIEQPTSGRR